ncbi:SAM-dependent methyltransferase [Gemella sp. oral taxon 928]|uniref:class I SAM-dependent methyltransferase n=1 Tax=Gemella sp. oral taxon 928 TaxID=1785995 RepID=UPI000767F8D3|nr:class I SAM-dependent methyltransferase [Gemella sp. oral taxon 928]AME10046.1 SAM-dependent methyltransferase [Gemella sp. oral taxon 928]
MKITTSVRTNDKLIERAKEIAHQKKFDYIERKKQTVKDILTKYKEVVVVYKDKLVYYNEENEFFFHPDTAFLRIKNNDNEPLIEIINAENQRVLDATMGLASDSIVISYYGHKVVAVEKSEIIHLIVSKGLKNYISDNKMLIKALRNIETILSDNLEYLKNCTDNSFDVVYFDPMFINSIMESNNLQGIEKIASRDSLSEELLVEAKRVASKKIVVKAHFRDDIFEKFGFKRIVRKNSKFHYGVIELDK